VELRQMRPIIRTAAQEADTADGPSDLDAAIEDLIDTPERTIQEAYENTVEMVVEAGKFARQCDILLARLDRLLRKADSEEDRQTVIAAVRALRGALEARLPEASEQ
jgi:ParB family chromosome partitioning protein